MTPNHAVSPKTHVASCCSPTEPARQAQETRTQTGESFRAGTLFKLGFKGKQPESRHFLVGSHGISGMTPINHPTGGFL